VSSVAIVKVDVYGRYQLEVVRENGAWSVYRLETGKRIRVPELGIPPSLEPKEIPEFLDDLYHEMARPGQSIRVLAEAGGGDA
jgi:hypothetical protein